MKARGNSKIIIAKVGDIQELIGEAIGDMANDRDRDSGDKARLKLRRAFQLCVDVMSLYDPV